MLDLHLHTEFVFWYIEKTKGQVAASIQYIIYQDQIFSRREKLTRIIIILGGHQLLVSKVITSSDQISL